MFNNTNSKEILDSLIEISPAAIFDLDTEGRVNSIWNPAAEEIFGWEKEEVLGEPLPIIPEGRETEFNQLRRRVLNGKAFFREKTTRQRKDGSAAEVSLSAAPLREEGEVVGIMAVVEEITERRRAERSREESEKKFKEIFNNAEDAMFFQALTEDEEYGQFIEVNDKACEMLGYSKEEFQSMTPADIDVGAADNVVRITEEITSKGRSTFESAHVTKDGSLIPVEVSAHFFKLNGENRVLTIARDITERKEAEERVKRNKERLEAAMEAGNLAWWQMELPSGEVTFSDLKAEMLGYPPERFENYSDFTDLLHPEDYEKAMGAMRDHLDGEKERYEVEYRLQKKNGDYEWFRDVGRITGEEGEYTVVTGVVIDVDRRKRAELNLHAQRAKLRDLHEAVDEFQQCETERSLWNVAVDATQKVLDFDLSTFYILEEEKFVPVAGTGETKSEGVSGHEKSEGLAWETHRKNQSLMGEDLREEEKAVTERTDLRGYMSVPIGDVGVFQIASTELGAFDQDDLELAEILAGHLHEEVKRIRLEEELKAQAIRDPLTKLYNRRYFNETLSKEIERSERYGHKIAFLMIDVDRFKEINDTYSHQTGDRVLQEVANLLRNNVRSADTLIRYGGDEFLVMMPETNGEVENTLSRLEEEVERWNRDSDLLDFPLSLAMGVSHWNPDQEREVEAALKEADEKMYEDKR